MRKMYGKKKKIKRKFAYAIKVGKRYLKAYAGPVDKIENLIDKRNWFLKHSITIQEFGHYRNGLTLEEINEYLRKRTGKKRVKRLRQKFDKIMGVTTCAIGPEQQVLIYRHDVKRFADVVLLGIPTYFD